MELRKKINNGKKRMKRLQFYLEPRVDAQLERLAAKLKVSKAQLIREGIRLVIIKKTPLEEDPAFKIIGLLKGEDFPKDAAENHDKYIYVEDWKEGKKKL